MRRPQSRLRRWLWWPAMASAITERVGGGLVGHPYRSPRTPASDPSAEASVLTAWAQRLHSREASFERPTSNRRQYQDRHKEAQAPRCRRAPLSRATVPRAIVPAAVRSVNRRCCITGGVRAPAGDAKAFLAARVSFGQVERQGAAGPLLPAPGCNVYRLHDPRQVVTHPPIRRAVEKTQRPLLQARCPSGLSAKRRAPSHVLAPNRPGKPGRWGSGSSSEHTNGRHINLAQAERAETARLSALHARGEGDLCGQLRFAQRGTWEAARR